MEGQLFSWCRQVLLKYDVKPDEMDSRHQEMIEQDAGNVTVQYRDHVTQCTYIRSNVTLHSTLVTHLMSKIVQDRKISLFNKAIQPKVKIASIGCGPGTEMIGVLNHIMSTSSLLNRPKLQFLLMDSEYTWKRNIRHFAHILDDHYEPAGLDYEYKFIEFDILKDTISDEIHWDRMDLFLFSFLFSDIVKNDWQKLDLVRRNLNQLWKWAKTGAQFLIVDNGRDEIVVGKIKKIYEEIELPFEFKGPFTFQLPPTEEKNDLKEFFSSTCPPKLNMNYFYLTFSK